MNGESMASRPQARVSLTAVSQSWHTTQHWPAQAEEETTQLRAALGLRVREIDNVASTPPCLDRPPGAIIDLQAGS
jgi:hypothetical protein